MPNFKPKTNKKIVLDNKNTVTLDNKHNELLKKFDANEKELIPEYKNKILNLKNRLKTENLNISEKLDIKDEIKEYKSLIKKLENEKREPKSIPTTNTVNTNDKLITKTSIISIFSKILLLPLTISNNAIKPENKLNTLMLLYCKLLP